MDTVNLVPAETVLSLRLSGYELNDRGVLLAFVAQEVGLGVLCQSIEKLRETAVRSTSLSWRYFTVCGFCQ